MSRWRFALIAFAIFVCVIFAGCAIRRLTPCLVGDPGVQVMTVRFVCPYVGASYETTVIKCPGDRHFRRDFICQLCGRRHHYDLEYLPYPYLWNDYYFYGGYWYSSYYWQRHWSYPPSYGRRSIPLRPPVYVPARPPARPPVGPAQDPQRSRELRSPVPSPPRYTQPKPSASPAPRPEPIRVAPPAPSQSPARGQSPRGSKSR